MQSDIYSRLMAAGMPAQQATQVAHAIQRQYGNAGANLGMAQASQIIQQATGLDADRAYNYSIAIGQPGLRSNGGNVRQNSAFEGMSTDDLLIDRTRAFRAQQGALFDTDSPSFRPTNEASDPGQMAADRQYDDSRARINAINAELDRRSIPLWARS